MILAQNWPNTAKSLWHCSFNLLALSCFVCYWGFQPTFERHALVELNETLVRAAGAGHRPQQHLLSVLLLAQIHLQKLKIMPSLVFDDENLLSARYSNNQTINQSINQSNINQLFYCALFTELNNISIIIL